MGSGSSTNPATSFARRGEREVGDAFLDWLLTHEWGGRRENGPWLKTRAKLVRKEFVQDIGEHWSPRTLTANAVSGSFVHSQASGR